VLSPIRDEPAAVIGGSLHVAIRDVGLTEDLFLIGLKLRFTAWPDDGLRVGSGRPPGDGCEAWLAARPQVGSNQMFP
jgi:hypothetical protein